MREENPFEDPQGAKEWIATVENERGSVRDKEIYPQLAVWVGQYTPKTIVDLGAGQGICSIKLGTDTVEYVGVEPSETLVARAKELYGAPYRKFLKGSAYDIPLPDGYAEACFSITTWFHLKDLDTASRELARILKPEGHFMIITPNPNAYDVWETFYSDIMRKGKVFIGKTRILLNPGEDAKNYRFSELSKNTFYLHTLADMTQSLEKSSLVIDAIDEMGLLPISKGKNIFITILGHKPATTDQ